MDYNDISRVKKLPHKTTISHLELKKFNFQCYSMTVLKGLHKRKRQTLHSLISGPLLGCCQCLSLLCFHLSALGRKPEGNGFRMEKTSEILVQSVQAKDITLSVSSFLSLSLLLSISVFLLCLPFVS